MHRFPTPTPPRLTIRFRAGIVEIDTEDVSETIVELHDLHGDTSNGAIAATVIEQRGNDIVVVVPKRFGELFMGSTDLALRVTAPSRTALDIESGSAQITARGEYGTTVVTTGSGAVTIGTVASSARVRSGSGDLRIDSVEGDLDVRSGSGAIDVGSVGGSLSVQSGSGDVRLGTGGTSMRVKTGSGDVSVDSAPDQLHATTGSGDVRVGAVRRGEISVRVASGDIHAGVRSGTAAWLDVRTITGRVSSQLESAAAPGADDEQARLKLESVSGDIELVRV